jgi:hypothetical protein
MIRADELRRKRRKGKRLSLRAVAAELAARGHVNEKEKQFSAVSISNMLSV